ncbi:MAG: gliding motility-associated C-terminal domain-containing protein [Flavobacteriaceae bacterium]|jgi:gliding motility-associated-like protein|nr:gliding motility-associated C-terminal domain-containing protein [Flavobacteriaceae bacterium]
MIRFLEKFCFILFFFFGIQNQVYALDLAVSATNETCMGNGSLFFEITDAPPEATISYSVYLLPNISTPIAVLTTNTLPGLNAGNYRIIATQILKENTSSAQQDIEILNEIEALSFTISDIKERCGNDGMLTVNVTSGVAVLYEIIFGPVIVPLQDSNVFNGLTAGQYQIRVYDNCGDAVVQTHTLLADSLQILIDSVVFPPGNMDSCDTILVSNYYSTTTGYTIAYPLQITHEVFIPGGDETIVFTQTIENGSNTGGSIVADLPYYNGQQYYYNLTVTDACGNVYTRNNNLVFKEIEITISVGVASCDGMMINIYPLFYVAPYTIQFIEAPDGFVPEDFNTLHPGPFTENVVTYGAYFNAVPDGNYTIQFTDACGSTVTKEIEVNVEIPPPSIMFSADDCGNTFISIGVHPPIEIESVILTNAPQNYPENLPENLNGFIAGNNFIMPVYWQGLYSFEIADSCGDTHVLSVFVPQPTSEVTVSQRPGCELGYGGIRVNGIVPFTSVILVAAPEIYTGTLPLDISNSIIPILGSFSFGSVPEGIYTFLITDECENQRLEKIEIIGYQVDYTEKSIFENCGSFDLHLLHSSNANLSQAFWLQKYNPETDSWGHPVTGFLYDEEIMPNTINSLNLVLGTLNLNIASVGSFRILKTFLTFNQNGSTITCVQLLDSFIFNGSPQIEGVYAFSCENQSAEVIVEASGIAPLYYKITHKNGQPFIVDNETENHFTNLEPALYNFEVSDNCGNIVNSLFDVNLLSPFSVSVSDLCNNQNGFLSLPNFNFLNYQWWKADNPSNILSTTYKLEFLPFDYETHAGLYVVAVTSQNETSCINQEISIEIGDNMANPNAGEDATTVLCIGNDFIDLFSVFTSQYDDFGTWEDLSDTGFLTGSVLNTSELSAGIYEFQYTVVGFCNEVSQSVISIEIIEIQQPPEINFNEICEGETLQISAEHIPGVQYHWQGPNGFMSDAQNIIVENASLENSGIYTMYISLYDCISETVSVQVDIKEIPQFTISGNNQVCEGMSSLLTVNPNNFDISESEIAWYFNEEPIANVSTESLEVFESGVYEVVVTVNSCESSQTFEVFEGESEIIPIIVSACTLDRFVLTVINAEAFYQTLFVWEGPNGFYATGFQIDITNEAVGVYSVTAIPEGGCVSSGEITVTRTRCVIPKGLSPNNDFTNDGFDLTGFDVLKVKIFNRYGMLMYEQDNYVNEWKGQSKNGNILPSATYYYLITFRDGSQKTGWVYLQREH